MNWNDVNKLWREQPADTGVVPEWNRIAREMADTCRQRSRQRFFRNVREALVGVGLSVALVSWSNALMKTWTGVGAALLVLIPALVYFGEAIHARRSIPPEDLPLRQRLEQEMRELRRERRLLRTIGVWCLLPLAAAWALLWTKLIRQIAPDLAGQTLAIGWLVLFQCLFVALLVLTQWRIGGVGARRIEYEIENLERIGEPLSATRE